MSEMLQNLIDGGEARLLHFGGDRGVVVIIVVVIVIIFAARTSGMMASSGLGLSLASGVNHDWRDGNGRRSCVGKVEGVRMIQTR